MKLAISFNKSKNSWDDYEVIEGIESFRYTENILEVTFSNNIIECYPLENIKKVRHFPPE